MNHDEARERISRLSEEIHKYNHSYYVDNLSLISDFDFDMLLKELEALEIEFNEFAFENSPTKRVGGDITKKFESVTHRFPMLSLGNTYSEEEIVEWVVRAQKLVTEPLEFVCELKYDRIISNPPYIPFRESASMEINVLNFEPELALFVPNDNPLLFYKRIMDVSMLLLNENGCLFLEIHENYAFEITGLLKENGFINIELRKDLQGKPRMIKAKKATFIV